jgi:Holliday junction DNA helicase RuvA
MINYLKGQYKEVAGCSFVLVNNVGYKIKTTGTHVDGEEVEFIVNTLTSSSGELTLYGFSSEDEFLMFNELIKIQGVGGVMALNILNAISPNDLIVAVNTKNKDIFKGVKGLGSKIIDRILASLEVPQGEGVYGSDVENQAIKALTTLGFTAREASNLIKSLSSSSLETVEDYVAKALQVKGKDYNVR